MDLIVQAEVQLAYGLECRVIAPQSIYSVQRISFQNPLSPKFVTWEEQKHIIISLEK